jgi:PHD/YefM family antitoxin component YafN of YafNO toxin-antitoxin module
MSTIDFKEAKEKLEALCDETASTREPIVLKRPGHEDVALIAADELVGYMETTRLLSSTVNAERLLGALERSRRGEGVPMTPDEIKHKFLKNGTGS